MDKRLMIIWIMGLALIILVGWIGFQLYNAHENKIYNQGVSDGITYRNYMIINDLSQFGETKMSIVQDNKTSGIVLAVKNGQ